MAVKFLAAYQRYVGLSTDTKPTSVPVGSTFLEYDTSALYITYDGTLWVLKLANPVKRDTGTLHRNAIASADKLALPGTLTLSAVTEAGSTLANVAYYAAVSAYNRWGPTGPGVIPGAITPLANQAVRIAFAAVPGADGYDVFLSTAAQPLWVTRITEAQRAAGGIVSSVGGYAAGGAPNSIDIGIVGTGLACNVAPFTANNAYTPATVTALNCTGWSKARVLVKLAVTDLRSAPSLSLVPFLKNQVSSGDWHAGASLSLSVLSALGYPLAQELAIDVDGATGLVVLVDTISGQGAAASVWIERS